MEEMQKQYKEFLHILHPTFPHVNTLQNHRTFTETKKLTLVQTSKVQNILGFHYCPFTVPGAKPNTTWNSAVMSLSI